MSMGHVRRFLRISEGSGYRWSVVLSGGEPLLWRHIRDAVTALHASPSVEFIRMFSNGGPYVDRRRDEMDQYLQLVDRIGIPNYGWNVDAAAEMKRRLGSRVSFLPHLRPKFYARPDRPIMEALPEVCSCRALVLDGDVLSRCPGVRTISAQCGWDFERAGDANVGILFPETVAAVRRPHDRGFAAKFCTICPGNRSARPFLEFKVPKRTSDAE